MRHLPFAVAPFLIALPALGQIGAHDNYLQTLTADSTYMREDCLGPCACSLAPATGPLTGTFDMVFDHADQWTSYYTISNVDLHAVTSRENTFFAGTGTYEIGGDFALTERLVLDLHPTTNTAAHYVFDSGTQIVHNPAFPAINLTAPTPVAGCVRRTITVHTTATPLTPACPADLGSAGGVHGPDGALDNNDFIAFIDYFFAGDPHADLGSAGGVAGADGLYDNNDFIAFINDFFAGC